MKVPSIYSLSCPYVLILASISILFVECLHEDQIGKFDWRQQYIGKPKFVHSDEQSESLIVITDRDVLASLNTKDGAINWRRLLTDCEITSAQVKSINKVNYVKTNCPDGTSVTWNSATGLVASLADNRTIDNPISSGDHIEKIWPHDKRPSNFEQAKSSLKSFIVSSNPFKVLIVELDYTVGLYDSLGNQFWSRNEALAYVIASEFVELPPRNSDEDYLDYNGYRLDIGTLFVSRLKRQYRHLIESVFSAPEVISDAMAHLVGRAKGLINLHVPTTNGDKLSQYDDIFGLHKIILVLCENGKLFGLDYITGKVEWSIYDEDLASIQGKTSSHLFILKNSLRSDDLAVVIRSDGHLLSFNPTNGIKMEKKRFSSIKQVMPLNRREEDKLRGLLVLDQKNTATIFPEQYETTFKQNIESYFIAIVERSPPAMQGYKFVLDPSGVIKAEETWRMPFVGDSDIEQVSFKRPEEPVHSPARVLGDRNILYKYLNPNLVAVVTRGTENGETHTNLYLIDSITGSLIYTAHHPKTRGPTRVVHSENWLVYSYFGYKVRRTEVSSIELFEGSEQVNSTAFSSLSRSGIQPQVVEHKTFIFPSGIEAMKDTITKRGITYKHVIMGLPSGALLEVPKIFLDPRRPIDILPEHREEGLVQYIPELPIPAESMINYNQTILAIRGIQTASTNLESTCLVFAYGLDLFSTRVTPSKAFDILNEDFDHLLIVLVLVFMTVCSYAGKMFAQRKNLQRAWRC